MLADILRGIDEQGAISTAELSRRLGISRAMVLQALRDLESRGYLERIGENSAGSECAPACTDCPLMAGCFGSGWQLTEKARGLAECHSEERSDEE